MTIHLSQSQDIYDLSHVSSAIKMIRAINPVDSSVIEREWHNDVIEMLESWERQLEKHLKSQGVDLP